MRTCYAAYAAIFGSARSWICRTGRCRFISRAWCWSSGLRLSILQRLCQCFFRLGLGRRQPAQSQLLEILHGPAALIHGMLEILVPAALIRQEPGKRGRLGGERALLDLA